MLAALIPLMVLLCAGPWTQVFAHESQPGLLQLTQQDGNRHEVLWRAPIYHGKPHPASFQLSDHWKTVGTPTTRLRVRLLTRIALGLAAEEWSPCPAWCPRTRRYCRDETNLRFP